MKKVILLMAALAILSSSKCSFVNGGGNKDTDPVDTLTTTPSAADLVVMVYSNAYDGFLNVREQPDVKSPVIGKILNGPMGAVKMGEIGGWTIVKVGETVGYASSRYLQTEPTKEFTDKDMMKYLTNTEWVLEAPMNYQHIILLKDGLFAYGYELEGWTSCGTWTVKSNVLTLHECIFHDFEQGYGWTEAAGPVDRDMTIVSGDEIIHDYGEKMKKEKILSDDQFRKVEEMVQGEPAWYILNEERLLEMYETAYRAVNGTYPPGK